MSTQEKTLRDKYFSNEIFRIGEMVQDTKTGESMKILDRGSNYVTVATESGVLKKWLSAITEIVTPIVTPEIIVEEKKDQDFEILESGQIKLFGHETKNFDRDLSELVIEQFGEFEDLYSKHQIIKCLDFGIQEDDADRAYNLIERVEAFYKKNDITPPHIVEAIKTDVERKRIAEILASVAGVKPGTSNYQTINDCIAAFKEKYKTRQQWQVLYPFLKMAQTSGIAGATTNLPYKFEDVTEENLTDNIVIEAMEDNLELLVEDLEFEDIENTFTEDEFISEVLSIETRNKLSRKIKQHSSTLEVKRERAMNKAASTTVLLDRARRLAETMLKRRMFHKAPDQMSRADKERFEGGASKRRALVARLAMKLVPKVRILQNARLHHQPAPATHTHDIATAKISAATPNGTGAS